MGSHGQGFSESSSSRNDRFPPGLAVAVIGAGISGVVSAAHLLQWGLKVTIFERSADVGGVWHLDSRVCHDPEYPSETPSRGDYPTLSEGRDLNQIPSGTRNLYFKNEEELERWFAPPSPSYSGLKNNVPISLLETSLAAWPEGTPEYTERANIETYIHQVAAGAKLEDVIHFHTRVESVEKPQDGRHWHLRTLRLDRSGSPRLVEEEWKFGAVIVASGHYNLPKVPDIPGLKEWKSRFGRRIIHSKQYRTPDSYRGRNVLVIGASVSSLDICRELSGVAQKTYQICRSENPKLPDTLLPANAERIGEIENFEMTDLTSEAAGLGGGDPIPGKVILKNGDVLEGIHDVVLGTGYIPSYPFLPQLHEDHVSASEASHTAVITSKGDMAHNLHKDIFYIEDPTLVFVGVPFYNATFSLFDFQAQVVARVFAGEAHLPGHADMRIEYGERLQEKGVGKIFNSLMKPGMEEAYVRDLVKWVNRDAETRGIKAMRGHSKRWLQVREAVSSKVETLLDRQALTEWPLQIDIPRV